MKNEPLTPFEDVIDEIMLEEDKPTHAALTRWTIRHPEHRDALSRFFATWAVQESSKEKVEVDEAVAGERMVSKALSVLYGQAAQPAVPAAALTPQRLCKEIKSRGLTDTEFAAKCDLDESLVDKLDLRRINFTSIPQKLCDMAAGVLGTTADAIRSMWSGDPIAAGANKAKGKPVVTTEDFLNAVDSSDLPENLKVRWVEIVTREKKQEKTDERVE